MIKKKRKMSLLGHDEALGGSKERIFLKFDNLGEQVRNLEEMTKKICETNRKYFRGHLRTSLVPGIQQPLYATDVSLCYCNAGSLLSMRLLSFSEQGHAEIQPNPSPSFPG